LELARLSGISPASLSLLENKKVDIGKKRAEQLAKAFNVHPATIMFPTMNQRRLEKQSDSFIAETARYRKVIAPK
jgi:transcriptional regulator with XRE-family HTH domain